MKTIQEISEEVLEIVQDDGYNLTNVINYSNDALIEIAGRAFLPSLQTQDTVDTVASQNYAPLPSNFHRNLFYCYSQTNVREIKVYADFRHILRMVNPIDQGGYVFGVAVRGKSSLHYQRIPSTPETLQIHFYEEPTIITSGDDTPDCLPDHLARPLLVNYCCHKIFSLIEDSSDGKAFNTERYASRFEAAFASLVAYLGPESSFQIAIPQTLDWDSF